MKSAHHRNGFTLLELSIVLIIIGMLVGGILVGMSLIDSAKINAAAQQVSQFDASVMVFKSKYKYLPGDAPGFGGDGDGIITMGANVGWRNYVNSYTGEIANFWNNLNPSTFAASTTSVGIRPQTSGASRNVPAAKLGSSGSFFMATAPSALGGAVDFAYFEVAAGTRENYYAILPSYVATNSIINSGFQQLVNVPVGGAAAKPTDLLALDKKIDDGVANTGNVLAANFPKCWDTSAALKIDPTPLCSVGANYTLDTNTYDCTPAIRMGATAGNPL